MASHGTEPPLRTQSNTAGTRHEPRSTDATDPEGSTRDRFAARPPPVTWDSACTPRPSPPPTPKRSTRSRHSRVYRRVGSRSSSPRVRPNSPTRPSSGAPVRATTERTRE